MGRTIDMHDWYGILLTPENAEAGDAFLRDIRDKISDDSAETDGRKNPGLEELQFLFSPEYSECRALIEFVLRNEASQIRFNEAAKAGFHAHNIRHQIIPLDHAGKSITHEESQRAIRAVCNDILGLVNDRIGQY